MKMRRFGGICAAVALCVLGAVSLQAQSGEQQRRDDGWRLRSVGVSADYFHQTVPSDVTTFEDVFLGSSGAGSANANVSYRHSGRRSFVSLASESVYGMRAQKGTQKNWNESVNGDLFAKRGKWTFGGGGNASVLNFDQAMFANSTLSMLASSNSGYRDLASAVTHNQIDSPALANGGRLEQDTTAPQFFLGRRVASMGGEATLSYSRNRRSAFDTTVGASSIRHLNDGSDTANTLAPSARTMSVSGNYRFSPSPRTEMTIGGSLSRSTSSLLESTGRTISFSTNHSFRRHLFVQGSFGGGATSGGTQHKTFIYSGGGGLKMARQSFIALYGRDISRVYSVALGLDSAFFETVSFSWYLRPRRGPWWVSTNYTHYRDQPPGNVRAPTTWLGRQTFGTELGAHYSVLVDASIGRTGARRYIVAGRAYQLEQTAFRVSLQWSPQGNRDRR